MVQKLTTAAEVMTELGGVSAVASLTGRKYSAAFNWKSFDAFPPNTFLVMQQALRERGFDAPASLWGMIEHEGESAA